jgi:hypothetical protein
MVQDNQVVLFQPHPPERKRRSTVLLVHGCCCCCLHSAGGIAGSIWGSLRRNAPSPDSLTTPEAVRQEEEVKTAHRLAVKVYWLVFTILSFLSIVVTTLINHEDAIVGAVLTLIYLPALQLLASLLTLLWIPMKEPVRKQVFLRRLGRISLYGFLGALIGSIGLVVTFFTIGR